MGIFGRLKAGVAKLTRRPGTTVDIAPLEALLPDIAAREEALAELSDEELAEAARATEDEVEFCAVGREAARRALGERPYDVQLVGAMAMLAGNVAEMATGEGKTLTATMTALGLAQQEQPVHVLTVNDYLARRDAEWMGPVYKLLGLTVGWVGQSSTPEERRAAYACDVTYGSISEVGFDLLRDSLVTDPADRVQRGLSAAIIDEADSILVDEARVPLVLAGTVEGGTDLVHTAAELVGKLKRGKHYTLGEDGRSVALTGSGTTLAEKELGGVDLYEPDHLDKLTAVNLALHAETLVTRDVDYIVRDGKVELVDEHRGRIAQRRRWPDGLQAAVEAKEGLDATAEGEVLGTITVQALVNLYPFRCGMTGTAVAVGEQLREFYKLEVAVIEPNRPCVRVDEPDRVYATAEAKEDAIVAEIAVAHAEGRPVLVGTLDVAESERIADALRAADVECVVLNAKNDAAEAAVIAEAGREGAVTVSTQMAGRGTDIRLGGSDGAGAEDIAELGGLYVIGTGRHHSSRVDDQLRGRAGRQGDPGGSVFYVSLEDPLVTRHAPEAGRRSYKSSAGGLVYDDAVGPMVHHAQLVAEGVTLEIHRNTWRYHVVLEQQRQAVGARREELLTTDTAAELLKEQCEERYEQVEDKIGEEALVAAARGIALYHCDRAWAEHLAYLAEVREGVHLRALGRLDPLDEYHRESVPAFRRMLAEIDERTVATFEEAEIGDEGWTPADAGLVRPSATWTYMVHDNPFGSELERLLSLIARALVGRGRS